VHFKTIGKEIKEGMLLCRVYYFYLLPFQVEEAANNWNSASTGIGKKIH